LPKAASATFFLTVGAAVFWIGFYGGSYEAVGRGSVALAVWWAVALGIALSVWPVARIPRGALVAGGLLAAYTAWVALSFLWGEGAERTLTELNRASLYLGVFALAVVARNRLSLPPTLAGLALGLTGIGLVALASRLGPDLFSTPAQLAQIFPTAEKRLSYPVNYWNGLATLVGFSLPLLLYFATTARSPALRSLALSPVPALAGTIYLTSSRGGALVAGLGTIAFVALSGPRWRAAGAALVAGGGAAIVYAILHARPELVNEPYESDVGAQGRSAALLIVLVCLGTAGLWGGLSRFAPTPLALPRTARYALVAGLVVLLAVGIAAADPQERFERFKEAPPELAEASIEEHLFSGSGNGRWQLWGVAVDEFERERLLGRGAGTYEAAWAQQGTLTFYVRDAHSLYLETLGELGVVGLVLLAGALVAVFVVGAGRLRAAGDPVERTAVAALLGILVAYAFEAGVDWMWELTVVSVVAFFAAGLVTGPATLDDAAERPRMMPLARAGAVAAAALLLAVQTVPLLSTLKIEDSRAAAASGDAEAAVEDARAARSLTPWAASPRLQLALAEELAGDVPAATNAILEALERDRLDWRLWLVAARLQTKAGDFEAARASLERAEELNPRSPLFDDLD